MIHPERNWDGTKTALITGGTRRLGKIIAQSLVDDGWRVIITGRNENKGIEVRREIGAKAVLLGDLCDMETYSEARHAVNGIFDGKLGLLINNASTFVPDGKSLDQRWIDFSNSLWNAHWVYCLTYELKDSLNACGGLVVNLTDWANKERWKGFVAHGAAKAAIEDMSQHMNEELPQDGTRGMAVVSLRLPSVLLPDGIDDTEKNRLVEKYGEVMDPAMVTKGIRELSQYNRFGFTAVLKEDGKVSWHS